MEDTDTGNLGGKMSELKIVTDFYSLNVSDGATMQAYVAHPDDDQTHPGMIVIQEAFGVNVHIRNVADRLAQEGYVAIAPEIFHRTAEPGFEGSYTDFAGVMPHMQSVTHKGAEMDLRAAHEWLKSKSYVDGSRIATIGFCMGGRLAFLANSSLPLCAAISFYGGNIPTLLDRVAGLHAPMLFFWGELDKHIGLDQRQQVLQAMKTSGKQYTNVEFSDADHGFFCDVRASYQPQAARLAWKLSLEFLAMHMGGDATR